MTRFQKNIFPMFIIFIFIICPLLFSFDNNENDLLNLRNNIQVEQTNSKALNKTLLVKNSFWKSSNSEDIDNSIAIKEKFLLVSYDPNRISIFSKAIESLINYYCSPSFNQLELPSAQSELSSILDTKYIPAAYNSRKPAFAAPDRSRIEGSSPTKKFFFENVDTYQKVKIPQALVTNGQIAVQKQSVILPRMITRTDKLIKISSDALEPMFLKHYDKYFKIDFKLQFERDPDSMKASKTKKVLKNYWRAESFVKKKAYLKLREDLFENHSVLKLRGCKYNFRPGTVTIYYDLNSDLFGVVGEQNNNFITGGVASLCDFIDIYYFRWLGADQTFNQSIRLEVSDEFIDPTKEYDAFAKSRDIGLPPNYDPKNWWQITQNRLTKEFLLSIGKSDSWYDQLKIGDNNQINEATELEAFTLLQLEAQNFIKGVYRPDKANSPKERKLNTDARCKSFNPDRIGSFEPTIIDVKALYDPEAIHAAAIYPDRSLEQQLDDIVGSTKFQQDRAGEFDEVVLHVINLFRVRPIDRLFVMRAYEAKAMKAGVDFDHIIFLNTSSDSIF